LEDVQHVYNSLLRPGDPQNWKFKCIPDGCIARSQVPVPPDQPFPTPLPVDIAACEEYKGKLSESESAYARNQLLMQLFYVLETRRTSLSLPTRDAGVVPGILIRNGVVSVLLATFNDEQELDVREPVAPLTEELKERIDSVADMTIESLGSMLWDLLSPMKARTQRKPAVNYREATNTPSPNRSHGRFRWLDTGIRFRFDSDGEVNRTTMFKFMCFKTRMYDLFDDEWDFWGPRRAPPDRVAQRLDFGTGPLSRSVPSFPPSASPTEPSSSSEAFQGSSSSTTPASSSLVIREPVPDMHKFGWTFKASLSSAELPMDNELLAQVDRFLGSRALSCSSPYFALPPKLRRPYQKEREDSLRIWHDGDTIIKSTRRCYDAIINEIAVLLYIQNAAPGNEYVVPVRRVFGGGYGIGFEMPSLSHFEIDPRRLFQMFEALSFIHSLGIVWRDVKPGNFMLDPVSDRVVVRLFPDTQHSPVKLTTAVVDRCGECYFPAHWETSLRQYS
jgi:hypothetical protein